MLQLLALLFSMLLAAGLSLWSGWRWLGREVRRVDSEMQRALRRTRRGVSVELRFDPSTGVYMPAVE